MKSQLLHGGYDTFIVLWSLAKQCPCDNWHFWICTAVPTILGRLTGARSRRDWRPWESQRFIFNVPSPREIWPVVYCLGESNRVECGTVTHDITFIFWINFWIPESVTVGSAEKHGKVFIMIYVNMFFPVLLLCSYCRQEIMFWFF